MDTTYFIRGSDGEIILVYPAPPPIGLPVGFASAPYVVGEGTGVTATPMGGVGVMVGVAEGVGFVEVDEVAEMRVKSVLLVSLTVGWLMLCTMTLKSLPVNSAGDEPIGQV